MKTGLWLWMLMLALTAGACRGQDWQPAEGPLTTPWTGDVAPEQVWPEYPRPQMVRPEWTNLNGLWDCAIVPREAEQPESWDGKILVPFAAESALSGVKKAVRPDQRLWYRRIFRLSATEPHQRLLLHFGAVDWQCTVWVNGAEVGRHTGGYDPFTFDITDRVRPGDNELVLAVWDPTDTGYQPRGKQVLNPGGIMYTAVTGIWQTVWLEPVNEVYIESVRMTPDVDAGVLRLTVHVAGEMSDAQGYNVSAVIHGNPPQMASGVANEKPTGMASGRPGEELEIVIASPILWSPDNPHLYDLDIMLAVEESVQQSQARRFTVNYDSIDRVECYFAMRKISVEKDGDGINRLFLNGEPLFQYGPLDQGWWPDGLYTPATDVAMKYDIEMTKKFGMNMARKHVKYECARWYSWCDKLGLLVWQDMPSGDAGRNDESKANYRRELKAMIDALYNFPSIVMWVPFNEGWGQHDTREVVQWIQQYDPSRPVNEASGWTDQGSGDISDMHSYPGPGTRPVEEDRAVVLGEFGGLGMPVKGHTWQDEENWGYVSYQSKEALTDAYVSLLMRMCPLIGQGLSAAVYTQTSDVEVEVNGLMTYDRKVVKMDLDRIVAAAEKLYLPPPKVSVLVPTSQQEPQIWRYTMTEPADGWAAADFDDSAWSTGSGGFGTRGTPGAVVGTVWNTSDIWLRRTFTLSAIPAGGQLGLTVYHDEDAEVYVNGELVDSFKGYVGGYMSSPLSAEVLKTFKPGANTLAVHCHQTRGGQGIDVGLVLIQEQPGQ